MLDPQYVRDLQAWRSTLDAEIRSPRGLLALNGLHWLQNGMNTIGSSPDCSICLPKPVPRLLGAFEFDGLNVKFHADVGQAVEIDGRQVGTNSALRAEDEAGPTLLRTGDLEMAIMRQSGRTGVRIWNATRARAFPGRVWYDIDEHYLVRAAYTPYPAPARIRMPNALGEILQGYAQGYVSFKLAGKSHNLDAAETQDGRLFLQFRDQTNEAQTYPEGRYLETEKVSEDGVVLLDFNKACNPPSAFTSFTACTFAPRETRLESAVEAGERYEAPRP